MAVRLYTPNHLWITQPDGTWTEYAYDSAHRLTGVADHIGNTITYALDAGGERTGEETRDPPAARAAV